MSPKTIYYNTNNSTSTELVGVCTNWNLPSNNHKTDSGTSRWSDPAILRVANLTINMPDTPYMNLLVKKYVIATTTRNNDTTLRNWFDYVTNFP